MKSKYFKKFNLNYSVIEDSEGVTEINLRDLFKLNYNNLPNLVDKYDCIYLITNLDNEKHYVGQAKDFYKRMCYGNWSHLSELENPDNIVYLQLALRKYKPKKFKVEILEENCKDLNERESYWIEYLHSCIYDETPWGYNMTFGGTDRSYLYSSEIRERIKQTNIERYGSPMGQCQTEESIINRTLTKIEYYGNAWGPHDFSNETKNKMRISQLFNSLLPKLDNVTSSDPKEMLDEFVGDDKHFYERGLSNYFDALDDLKSDERWNDGLNDIFYLLYEFSAWRWPDWTLKFLGNTNPITPTKSYETNFHYIDTHSIGQMRKGVLNRFKYVKSTDIEERINEYIYSTSKNISHFYRQIKNLFYYSKDIISSKTFPKEVLSFLSDIYEYYYKNNKDWTISNLGEQNPFKLFQLN